MADAIDPAVLTPPAPADLAASGKVTSYKDGLVILVPANTSYELQLLAPGYKGPIGKPVKGVIRVRARKVFTVPSGGNFIAPIFGTPRTIQGRVRLLEARHMVVQAGTLIHVDLPDDDTVYDLANGPLEVGRIVNVVAMPGAAFEVRWV